MAHVEGTMRLMDTANVDDGWEIPVQPSLSERAETHALVRSALNGELENISLPLAIDVDPVSAIAETVEEIFEGMDTAKMVDHLERHHPGQLSWHVFMENYDDGRGKKRAVHNGMNEFLSGFLRTGKVESTFETFLKSERKSAMERALDRLRNILETLIVANPDKREEVLQYLESYGEIIASMSGLRAIEKEEPTVLALLENIQKDGSLYHDISTTLAFSEDASAAVREIASLLRAA